MHSLDKIDTAAAVLRRADAVLAMILQHGPDAVLFQVIEANSIVREQIGKALAILEEEDYAQGNCTRNAADGPGPAQTAQAPAHGGASVVTLRPSQRG